jgi:hypothetical protein
VNTINIIIAAAAIGVTAFLMSTLATRRVLSRQYGTQGFHPLCGPPGPMGATGSTGPQGPPGEPGTSISCACPGTETIPVDYINPVDIGYSIPPHAWPEPR